MTVPVSLTDDPDVLVDVATSSYDRGRILREIEARTWASKHGIRTATTLACADDGAWIATQRLIDQPDLSMSYVESAWEAADRLSRLDDPGFMSPATTWRAPRLSLPLRAWRLARAGISPRTFVQTRGAATDVAHDALAHHDFHQFNVLNTPSRGGVTVLDWEYTSAGPRYLDFIQLIVAIQPDDLAQQAWNLLLDHAPDGDRDLIAVQVRWLALRMWASEAGLPSRSSDSVTAVQRRRRWAAAQSWADEIAPGVRS